MKAPRYLDLPTVVRTFEAIPELASAGALAQAMLQSKPLQR